MALKTIALPPKLVKKSSVPYIILGCHILNMKCSKVKEGVKHCWKHFLQHQKMFKSDDFIRFSRISGFMLLKGPSDIQTLHMSIVVKICQNRVFPHHL